MTMAERRASQPEGRWLYCWVHVSDIHMGHGTADWQFDQQEVLDALLTDVRDGVRAARMPHLDAVLCTGDIASTGGIASDDEYARARDWLDRLMKATGAPRLFTVPGNHDVQRTPASQLDASRLLRDLRDGSASLDESRRFGPDAALLDARLAHYTQFCESMGSPVPSDSLGAWTELVVSEPVGVRLIGWNSASLCNDDADREKLAIATSSRLDAKREIAAGEVAIVLMHHPGSWLAPAPRDKLTTMLEVHPAMVALLNGHLHRPNARRVVTARGDELVTLAAGAVHDDEGPAATHAYGIAGIWLDDDEGLWLRWWPRRFERGRFHADVPLLPEGETCTDIPLRRPEPPPDTAEDPAIALSDRQVDALGTRRTAFPTDLSIAELRARGLLVAPRLTASDGADVAAGALADRACAGDAALVLGPPGSGKTVLAYELADLVRQRGGLPLIIDLRADAGEAQDVEELLAAPGAPEADLAGHRVVVIADGLDEVLAGGMSATDLAARIGILAGLGGVVATCRESDYDHQLAATGLTDRFSRLCRLQPWRAEHEFATFVGRLAEAGMLDGTALVSIVADDEDLAELVSRPLYARMLTYVASEGRPPADVSELYGQYLGKLSVRAADDTRRAGCELPHDVLALWREAAWVVHRGGLEADALPLEGLIGALRGHGLDAGCAWRVLSPILDADRSADNRATFVHYSFYEHLVAQHVLQVLTSGRAAVDVTAPSEAFAVDLPREVRRHLTALMRRSLVDAYSWPMWLADGYSQAGGDGPTIRTVRNLIAYVVCRLDVPFGAQLRPLLEDEHDKFLRNSLMWALVRGDDREVLGSYVAELKADPELASLNRGYLLYYYGDLPRMPPPYRDDDPDVGWEQTRRQVAERLAQPEYAELAAARRVIDLYTFADLARSRGEHVTQHDARLLDAAAAALPEDLAAAVRAALTTLLDEVRP